MFKKIGESDKYTDDDTSNVSVGAKSPNGT